MNFLRLSVLKNSPRLKLKFRQHKMKLEKPRKLLKQLKKQGRELLRPKLLLKMKCRPPKLGLKQHNKRQPKPKQIWRKPKRNLPTGKNLQRKPKRKQHKRWQMQKLLKRNMKRSLKLLERLLKRSKMQHLKNKLKPSVKLRLQLRKLMLQLKQKEKLEKLNKLQLTKQLWLREELSSNRSSGMSGPQEHRVFPTCK